MKNGGAKTGALGDQGGALTPLVDPDLQRLVELWPKLNAATKQGVVALLDADPQLAYPGAG